MTSEGKTPKEVLRNLREAVEGHVQVVQEEGILDELLARCKARVTELAIQFSVEVKLPQVSGREVVCALLKEGFFIRNKRGSHAQLLGEVNGLKRLVKVLLYGNTDLKMKTLLSII